jgi:ubiquinone/menaquinone biosynthesis C-methylase UbiE
VGSDCGTACRTTLVTSFDSRLKRYYADRAGEYDRVYEKPERQVDLRALRGWLPTRLACDRLIEIACGTGYWTRVVAQAASEIVAIDAVPEMLEIARARVPDASVEFLVADAYRVPAELGTFDAALAAFWFSHVPIPRRREFLSGLSAVLCAGARVVLIDNRFVDGSSSLICGQDVKGNTFQTRQLADGSTHRVLKNFPSEDEVRASIPKTARHVSYLAFDYYWALEYEIDAIANVGRLVEVRVDRPLGSLHPEFGIGYPVNYGFVPGTRSADGEELDAYVLGPEKPLSEFVGRCIAVVHRLDDDDDKLVVVPDGRQFSDAQIRRSTQFQERFFTSEIRRR